MFAAASVRFAPVARMMADPGIPLVTGVNTVVELWGMVMVAGTDAMPGALDDSVTTSPPAGAGAESVSVRFLLSLTFIVRLAGVKTSAPFTSTDRCALP